MIIHKTIANLKEIFRICFRLVWLDINLLHLFVLMCTTHIVYWKKTLVPVLARYFHLNSFSDQIIRTKYDSDITMREL